MGLDDSYLCLTAQLNQFFYTDSTVSSVKSRLVDGRHFPRVAIGDAIASTDRRLDSFN